MSSPAVSGAPSDAEKVMAPAAGDRSGIIIFITSTWDRGGP
jgi:hypothetical protein